jgi:hypothetical protein
MRRAVWQISIAGLLLVSMLAVDGGVSAYAQDGGNTTQENSDGGSLFDQIEPPDTGGSDGDMSFTEGDVEQGIFDEKALACAAGYTCSDLAVTPKETQVLLGYNNAEEAQADYQDQFGQPQETDFSGAENETASDPDEAGEQETYLFDQIESSDAGAKEGDMSLNEGDVEQGVFDEKALACAAGYTCSDLSVTPKEAQVLLGYNNAKEAQADYQDQYGKLPEQTDVETGSEMSFEVEDVFEQSDPGNDMEDASRFPGVTPGHPLDLSSDPGFATSPDQCRGEMLLAPNFMGLSFKSHVCQTQNSNGQLGDCGTHAANLVCLTNGYVKSTCFGVGTAARSMGNGVVCQNGQCPAFSFVGCR